MRTPSKLAVPSSAAAVAAEVRKLLRAADVGKALPTPKAQIIACAKLVEAGELNLEEFERTRADRLKDAVYRAFGKVLGYLDRRTREVYVDPQLHDLRKTFVTYHEVTHRILPWQHFEYTEDDRITLNLNTYCETLFESEANFGAAEIVFQGERFEVEARDYSTSVGSALFLAERYGASYHSSLRRFAERNHRECLLLVLSPTKRVYADGSLSFFVMHSVPSTEFVLKFGDPIPGPFVNPDSEVGRILNSGKDGEIGLSDVRGFCRACIVECFCNQYNRFVMVYPKEAAGTGRKVLLRAS